MSFDSYSSVLLEESRRLISFLLYSRQFQFIIINHDNAYFLKEDSDSLTKKDKDTTLRPASHLNDPWCILYIHIRLNILYYRSSHYSDFVLSDMQEHVVDFHIKNLQIINKHLGQGFHFHEFARTV